MESMKPDLFTSPDGSRLLVDWRINDKLGLEVMDRRLHNLEPVLGALRVGADIVCYGLAGPVECRVVEIEDTPEVRGAIAKLPHMVEVVE